MKRSAASGGPPLTRVFDAPRPMLWVDGVPRPEAAVVRMTETGPLASRSVELSIPHGAAMTDAAHGGVFEPILLEDGTTRWRVLAEGSLVRNTRNRRAGASLDACTLRDDWADQLDRPLNVPWSERSGSLHAISARRLGVGDAANRSATRWNLGGASAYVPTSGEGAPWRLLDALELFAASMNLPLRWRAVERELALHRLPRDVALDAPLGDSLRQLLEPLALALRLESESRAGRTSRRLDVVSAATARRLALPRLDGQTLRVQRVRSAEDRRAATRWVGRGGRNEVESTFELVGGWDPGRESLADGEYDRSAGSDFASVRNVFRRWVLNEDGRFTGEPFDRGPAPDLAALLDNPHWSPTKLRLLPTLSLDAAGQRREPWVETSTDGGVTWAPWSGRIETLRGRAGVYLDDDALPAAWLTAVRDRTARLRVTATLRDPQPLRGARWDGNPLRGSTRERRVALGEAYTRRRIDPASMLADPTGESLTADDRAEMLRRLDRLIADDRAGRCAAFPDRARRSRVDRLLDRGSAEERRAGSGRRADRLTNPPRTARHHRRTRLCGFRLAGRDAHRGRLNPPHVRSIAMSISELVPMLSKVGAIGLIGALWVWERWMSRHRENQLSEAHDEIMKQRQEIKVLTVLVRRNTKAIERFDQTQSRLFDFLERIQDELKNQR